jgi:hypothetical protein
MVRALQEQPGRLGPTIGVVCFYICAHRTTMHIITHTPFMTGLRPLT